MVGRAVHSLDLTVCLGRCDRLVDGGTAAVVVGRAE